MAVVAAIVLSIAGCAAPPVKKEEVVFFPPAPELPRIQFLVSFIGQKDVEKQSSFQKFIVGEKPAIRLDKPYGVGIYDGKIYVCDTNATVMVFDFKEKRFGPLEGAKGAGRLIQPLNISIEDDGTKYVSDPVRGQVVVFDQNDRYKNAFGLPGKWKPVDAVPLGDRLYVADNMNAMVKVLDKKTGEALGTIGDKGDPSQKLYRPTNLAFDRDGNLYVTDVGRFQVVKFDRDGHYLSTVGMPGDMWGSFARPRGLTFDRDSHLYVVDAAFNNVQIFNKDGRLLMFFGGGEGGIGPGTLFLPSQVITDYNNVKYFQQYVDPSFDVDHLIIVVSQFGERMINVFAYGKQRGQKYPSDEELIKELDERRKQELEKMRKEEAAQKKVPEKTGEATGGAETAKPVETPAGK